MAVPEHVVEVAFTTDPGATPSWTDVSDYVRRISWNRGRSSELEDIQAGTCQVVLDNRDRRFDPDHATGPHFGDILPMRRMRVRAVYDSITYDVFTGYVEAYRQSWPAKVDATTTLECVDAFKVLSLAEVPASDDYPSVVDEVMDPVWGYYRLNEPPTSKIVPGGKAKSGKRGRRRKKRVKFVAGQAGPEALVEGGSPSFLQADANGPVLGEYTYGIRFNPTSHSQEHRLKVPLTDSDGQDRPGSQNTIAVSAIVKMLVNPASTAKIVGGPLVDVGGVPVIPWVLEFDLTSNRVVWRVEHSDATFTQCQANSMWALDTWVHVFACWRGDTGVGQLFVDGVRVARTASGAKTMRRGTGLNNIYIGGHKQFADFVGTTVTYTQGVIADVVIGEGFYTDSATDPDALALYSAAVDGYGTPSSTPLSGTRIEDILDPLFSGSDVDLDAGTEAIRPQRLDGTSRLELIRAVEATEGGVFFTGSDGKPTFRDADFRASSPGNTVHGTFGDSTGEIPYTDITTSYDEEFLYNVVTVTREDGRGQTVEDATSKTTFLPRQLEMSDMLHANDSAAAGVAATLLARYKDPALRVRSITVVGREDNPDTFEQVLARELYDRITVMRRPPGGGDPVEADVRIQGVSGDWEPGRPIRVTWNLAPEDH